MKTIPTKTITILFAVTLATTLNISAANAASMTEKDKILGATKFTAGAVVGGLVGGPLGAVAGALGGGLFAEQGLKARDTQAELDTARNNLVQLEREISMQEVKIAELEQETLARLELKVFFDTGEDQLSELDKQRLDTLVEYLLGNTEVHVGLDGYADTRGTDEYNNILSHERALSVKNALIEKGIADERIHLAAHGSSMSSTEGGLTAYMQDRRVDITLEPAVEPTVTQTTW